MVKTCTLSRQRSLRTDGEKRHLGVDGELHRARIATYLAVREVDGSYRQFLGLLLYPLAASLGMFAVVTVGGVRIPIGGIPKFLVMVATGAVFYGIAILAIETWENYGISDVFRTVVGAVGEEEAFQHVLNTILLMLYCV